MCTDVLSLWFYHIKLLMNVSAVQVSKLQECRLFAKQTDKLSLHSHTDGLQTELNESYSCTKPALAAFFLGGGGSIFCTDLLKLTG